MNPAHAHKRASTSRLLIVSGLLFLTCLLVSSTTTAQGRTEGTRSLGLASTFTANASGNAAIYKNPAGVATTMTYAFEGSYLYQPNFNTFNASVVDSKINPKLAMGVAYSYDTSSNDDINLSGHDGRVALGSPLLPNRLAVGIGGRYLNYSAGDTNLINDFTLNAGGILRIAEGFFAGVSGQNLIDVCSSNDEECPTQVAPRTLAGGLSFGSPHNFLVAAEASSNLSDTDNVHWTYSGSAEAFIDQFFAMRGGYRFLQQEEAHVAAAGLGLKSRSLGIDAGYQYNFQSKETVVQVALQLFMMN